MDVKKIIEQIGSQQVYVYCQHKGDGILLCDWLKLKHIDYKTLDSLLDIKKISNGIIIIVLNSNCLKTFETMRLSEDYYRKGVLTKCAFYVTTKNEDEYRRINNKVNKLTRSQDDLHLKVFYEYLCKKYFTQNYKSEISVGQHCRPINYGNYDGLNEGGFGRKVSQWSNSCEDLELQYESTFDKIRAESLPCIKYASAFAPSEIETNETLLVQVYVYKKNIHSFVVRDATQADKDISEKYKTPFNYNIEEGEQINVSLNIISHPEETQVKSAIWNGTYAKVSFYVLMDEEKFRQKKLYAQIFLSVKQAIVCEMNFTTNVVSGDNNYGSQLQSKLADIQMRCFHKIFISYSHKDREKVQYIKETCKTLQTVVTNLEYFYDDESLRSGDFFSKKIEDFIKTSDMFMLCWSQNAAQSNYIQREINWALPLAFPEETAKLRICPINIEPYAPLPDNLKSKIHCPKV